MVIVDHIPRSEKKVKAERCSMVEQVFPAAGGGPMLEQRKSVRRKEQQRETTVY